ncbi:MAG: hypothetical protein JSU06_01020 [Actinobacteria bacterium]|nr:hypothetical protein [Actinomycetota bacterium]
MRLYALAAAILCTALLAAGCGSSGTSSSSSTTPAGSSGARESGAGESSGPAESAAPAESTSPAETTAPAESAPPAESTAPSEGGVEAGGETPGGTAKKATAPNGPAGSKVLACQGGGAQIGQLRATAVDCTSARELAERWANNGACAPGENASRGSCSLGSFKCEAVKTDRGAAVSCAQPGEVVSFIAKGPSLEAGPSG